MSPIGSRRGLEELRAPDEMQGDVVLDTVGLYCPVPIIRTNERIGDLQSGQVIEVLSDDRVILIDMPAWCRSVGHDYLGFREGTGEWRLFVRRR
jgi:tRNA 2-thiouridine synthesizing protein A